MSNTSIRPFHIEIPQAALDDLEQRLRRTIWPDELPGVGDSYGVTNSRVKELADYWLNGFDWRSLEARLNAYPQFVTEIDGENIHFLHVTSSRPDATPLVLTHGWPGSIMEFLDVIAPLTEPASTDAPAFHVVIPSLPGFAFSGPTRSPGWNRYRTARAWAELMSRLGYHRYGAVGNDAGSVISPLLGQVDADHVVGVHVTQLFSFPSGDPSEFEGLTETDLAALSHLKWFYDEMFSFNVLLSQQPQTLAFALSDSPVGLLGWNAQLFGSSLDKDFILANVAIYWLTGTAASATRCYYEDAHTDQSLSGPTTAPTGLAMFAGDFQSIRRFAERDHKNIVSWNSYPPGANSTPSAPESPRTRDAGGHYAAHEATDLLVDDIRQFFNRISAAGLA